MIPPERQGLPFFAYGVFRPGQLAFHRLKPFVEAVRVACVRGELRVRDGLPILDPDCDGTVTGSLLPFRSPVAADAYQAIVDLEPDRQYRWDERSVDGAPANVLVGKSPKKGSVVAEGTWDGRRDPLFTVALEVVRETLAANEQFEWNLKPMFRLQMAYLLLWSAIERYVSLRYSLGDAVMAKIRNLASEPAFRDGLAKMQPKCRDVYRADKPAERIRLDANDPLACVEYYYQVRSNLVHRGKAVLADHERVKLSLEELACIFPQVLERGFADASHDA